MSFCTPSCHFSWGLLPSGFPWKIFVIIFPSAFSSFPIPCIYLFFTATTFASLYSSEISAFFLLLYWPISSFGPKTFLSTSFSKTFNFPSVIFVKVLAQQTRTGSISVLYIFSLVFLKRVFVVNNFSQPILLSLPSCFCSPWLCFLVS